MQSGSLAEVLSKRIRSSHRVLQSIPGFVITCACQSYDRSLTSPVQSARQGQRFKTLRMCPKPQDGGCRIQFLERADHPDFIFLGLGVARLQNEIAPEKALIGYEKWFEKRETRSEKRSET